MNNGVRIVIERQDADFLVWRLNAYGDELHGRAESSLVSAAEHIENHLVQIELSRQYKKLGTAHI